MEDDVNPQDSGLVEALKHPPIKKTYGSRESAGVRRVVIVDPDMAIARSLAAQSAQLHQGIAQALAEAAPPDDEADILSKNVCPCHLWH